MACAASRPAFSFHISTKLKQSLSPSKTKPNTTHFLIPKQFIPLISLNTDQNKPYYHSIDVSKEDKPASNEQQEVPPLAEQEDQEQQPSENPEQKFDKRRLEEKFAVLNTGIYECRSCGYKYDESIGDPAYPIPPGLSFEKMPVDWRCPTCGAAKSFFESKSVEIAGFAENQQYGLGGNALTSGQKAILIYGSLFLFFCLFLSGYFLQ